MNKNEEELLKEIKDGINKIIKILAIRIPLFIIMIIISWKIGLWLANTLVPMK